MSRATERMEARAEQLAEEAAKDGASDETKRAADQAEMELDEADAKEEALEAEANQDDMSQTVQRLEAKAEKLAEEAEKDGASAEAKRAADQASTELDEAEAKEQELDAISDEEHNEEDRELQTTMSQATQKLMVIADELAEVATKKDAGSAKDEAERAAAQAEKQFEVAYAKEQRLKAMADQGVGEKNEMDEKKAVAAEPVAQVVRKTYGI